VLNSLGPRFIFGGDFNGKHTTRRSRLTTPKGGELLNAISTCRYDFISSRKPTYWPTDKDKISDLIDFYISKGISANYLDINNVDNLLSERERSCERS